METNTSLYKMKTVIPKCRKIRVQFTKIFTFKKLGSTFLWRAEETKHYKATGASWKYTIIHNTSNTDAF